MNSIQKEQNQDKIDFLNLFGIDVFKLESTHLYPDNELYKYSIICNSKDLLQDLAENFEDKTNHINQLIKDNLKLIGEKDTYQLCPKCNGQGTLSKPPHLPDDLSNGSKKI